MKIYVAMNMRDFHRNQGGKPGTNVELAFVSAASIEEAKEYMKRNRPECAWSIIPKSTIDKNYAF